MSDTTNPFQSPEADSQVVRPLVSQGALSEIMVKYLIGASPWLRFLGIMGFIGCGSMVLVGIMSFAYVPFAGVGLDESLGDVFSVLIGTLAPMAAVYAVYFIGAGVVSFFPALFTYKFGTMIRSYSMTNSEADLEQAFRNNASLWKFKGILMIISLAAVPILIIISVVIIAAAMTLAM
ncbi:MAG: hypothetical protein LBI14_04635 [Treponema sp.]|nr:hypothetical protein [Treponema sp.]